MFESYCKIAEEKVKQKDFVEVFLKREYDEAMNVIDEVESIGNKVTEWLSDIYYWNVEFFYSNPSILKGNIHWYVAYTKKHITDEKSNKMLVKAIENGYINEGVLKSRILQGYFLRDFLLIKQFLITTDLN